MTKFLRIALIVCGLAFPLFSQATAGNTVDGQGASWDLVIQNRKVFSFRSGLGSMTPKERLNLAMNRLAQMPPVEMLQPVNYTLAPEAVVVKVGESPLFSIAPGDLDSDIGQTLEDAAIRVQDSLTEALKAEVAQRNVRNIVHSSLKSLVAISIFVFIAGLFGRGARRARRKIIRLAVSMPKLPGSSAKAVSPFDPRRISVWLAILVRLAHYMFLLISTYLCVTYVLECFPYTQPWGDTLGAGMLRLLLSIGQSLLHGIPGLFAVAVIAFIARALTQLINSFFKSVERGETIIPWIHQDTAAPTRRIAVALLWVFAIVLAYPHIPGNQSIAFKSISVFIGLLVSFGSAGVVNQAMNGLAIMYARSFRNGDYVKIGEVEGTVSELSLLSTKLHTIRQEEIIIPNSVVIAQTTYNYTRILDEHGVGISTTVNISYDTPWRKVHALLKMAAEKTKGLAKDPAPYIIQVALGGVCVEYTLVVHMVEEPKLRQFVKSDLHQHIQDVFNQYGVKIMTPTYVDMEIPNTLPPDRWYDEPAERP
ncbi:MAG: mechanosensitive ion channel family protein [Holophagaceae bacterium]|nr:mechanosensitive ion channel family protein [Holophagaceae bacterium]